MKGYVFALISATTAASLGIIAKLAYRSGLKTSTVITGRATLAFILIGIYGFCIKKQSFKVRIKYIPKFLVLGIVGLALNFTCFLNAVKYTTVTTAEVLLYTYPAIVSIFSHFLFEGEKLNKSKIYALLIALLGCFLAVGGYSFETISLNFKGILFGLGSGCAMAFYTIYVNFLLKNYSSLTISFWGFLSAALVLLCINPHSVKEIILASFYSKFLIVVIAFIPSIMTFGFLTKAVEKIGSSKTAITCTLEPVVASLFSLIILGEKFCNG